MPEKGNAGNDIVAQFSDIFSDYGLEGYPFKIGWYNDIVSQPFQMPYEYDTMAIVVLSLPHMFEKTFLPFIRNKFASPSFQKIRDPMDECMRNLFAYLKQKIDFCVNMDVYFDFDMNHNKRPKILMQTAGHVAGAAYYYRNNTSKPWAIGVSLHPKYGGWFAFRSVIVLPTILVPELVQIPPVNLIPDSFKVEELLHSFQKDWRTCAFRDAIPTVAKYSERQIKYFSTKPPDRFALLVEFLEEEKRQDHVQTITC